MTRIVVNELLNRTTYAHVRRTSLAFAAHRQYVIVFGDKTRAIIGVNQHWKWRTTRHRFPAERSRWIACTRKPRRSARSIPRWQVGTHIAQRLLFSSKWRTLANADCHVRKLRDTRDVGSRVSRHSSFKITIVPWLWKLNERPGSMIEKKSDARYIEKFVHSYVCM